MEVGISTASLYTRMYPEVAVDFIASTGCGICEIFLNTYSEYEPDFIEPLKAKLLSHSLKVISIHPMGTQFEPQLFSICSRQKKDAVRIFEKVLKAAQTLGAEHYIMHGPASMRGWVKNMQFERIGPITFELCEIAKSYGITLSWENVSWCLFNSPEFALRILESSKSEDLSFTLDIKQAVRSGYSPFEYMDAMGRKIANVHVCDYIEHQELILKIPGQGEFDFGLLKVKFKDISYDGPVIIEVYSDLYNNLNELKRSYEYLNSLLG